MAIGERSRGLFLFLNTQIGRERVSKRGALKMQPSETFVFFVITDLLS